MRSLFTQCLFIFLILSSINLYAENYALLVGVGDYKKFESLEGPSNDVAALSKVLKNNWGFQDKNIIRLINHEATKENILGSLTRLSNKLQPKDNALIYLSGHGTSYYDPMINIPLATTTGAFIPYDRTLTLDNLNLDQLIIGNRDLKPIFLEIDKKKARTLVIIDACFSGNTVREINKKITLPSRNIHYNRISNHRSYQAMDHITLNRSLSVYPYETIYHLAASSAYETAQEIPKRLLEHFPTIDGLPHGAFTDSLLYALSYPTKFDQDQDNMLSYGELKYAITDRMQQRGFEQIPSSLPPHDLDKNELSKTRLFGYRLNSNTSNMEFADTTLKSGAHDQSNQDNLTLKTPISLQRGVDEIIQLFSQKIYKPSIIQDFKFLNRNTRDIVLEGEQIGFSIRTDSNAYLLLVGINSEGKIKVLYPLSGRKLSILKASIPRSFSNFLVATKPHGTDHLFSYTLPSWDEEINQFIGKPFPLNSKKGNRFITYLTHKSNINSLVYSTLRIVPNMDI